MTIDQSTVLVDIHAVCEAVGVSRRLMDQWIKSGRVPVIRLGKRCLRFHLPSVMEALIKDQK